MTARNCLACRYPHDATQARRVTPCAPLFIGSDGVQRTARPTNALISYKRSLVPLNLIQVHGASDEGYAN
jgi:hypothetical protein